LVLRSPVMVSAREACVRLRLAGARRFLGPRKLPRPAGILAFFDKVGDPLGRHARIGPRTPWTALQGRHRLAGSIVSSPAMMTCICQCSRKALWLSRCGNHPTTNSNRRRSRSRRNRRSLCNHHNRARLPARRPWPLPCSLCRRHRMSPD
jgi:hypothetical protein